MEWEDAENVRQEYKVSVLKQFIKDGLVEDVHLRRIGRREYYIAVFTRHPNMVVLDAVFKGLTVRIENLSVLFDEELGATDRRRQEKKKEINGAKT